MKRNVVALAPKPAESAVPFGEIAVALEFCTADAVAEAFRRQETGQTDKAIGAVLIALNALTVPQRDEVLAYQRIHFVRMAISAGGPGDMRLGNLAVSRHLIGYADLIRALEMQQQVRDIDGNIPPLGKILVELNLVTAEQLAQLLPQLGVEVVECRGCRGAFNILGWQHERPVACPMCHSRRVQTAPTRVLDVEGTLRLGATALPASLSGDDADTLAPDDAQQKLADLTRAASEPPPTRVPPDDSDLPRSVEVVSARKVGSQEIVRPTANPFLRVSSTISDATLESFPPPAPAPAPADDAPGSVELPALESRADETDTYDFSELMALAVPPSVPTPSSVALDVPAMRALLAATLDDDDVAPAAPDAEKSVKRVELRRSTHVVASPVAEADASPVAPISDVDIPEKSDVDIDRLRDATTDAPRLDSSRLLGVAALTAADLEWPDRPAAETSHVPDAMPADDTAAPEVPGASLAAAAATGDADSRDFAADDVTLTESDMVWHRAYEKASGQGGSGKSSGVIRARRPVPRTQRVLLDDDDTRPGKKPAPSSPPIGTSPAPPAKMPGDTTTSGDGGEETEGIRVPGDSSVLAVAAGDPGRRIGPYVVQEEIGRGALGIVFRAVHERTGKQVALKVLLGDIARHPEFVHRLESQAVNLSRLEVPGIANLVDLGHDKDLVYVASRFVNGRLLGQWLRDGRPSVDERIDLLVRLAEALAFAHDYNLVHLDLNPTNILVDTDGQPWITDFGLAPPVNAGQESHTRTVTRTVVNAPAIAGKPVGGLLGGLLGTPGYMAPEQVKLPAGGVLDGRADQFVLGVIAYELFRGEHPFFADAAGDLLDVLEATLHREPPLLRDFVPDLPDGLEAVIFKALEKKPERRYPTMLDLAADFQRVLIGEPVTAHAPTGLSRLRKHIARQPGRYALVGATLLALMLWIGSSTGTFARIGAWLERPVAAPMAGPKDPDADIREAIYAAIHAGQTARADQLLRQLETDTRRQPEKWLLIADARRRLGDTSAAREAALYAIKLRASYEGMMLFGALSADVRDIKGALDAFTTASELRPDAEEPYRQRFELLDANRRYDDLRHIATQAVARFPSQSEFRAYLALALGMSNVPDRARDEFQHALQLASTGTAAARVHLFRARVALYPDPPALAAQRQALEWLNQAIAADREFPGLLRLSAEVQHQLWSREADQLAGPAGHAELAAVERADRLLKLRRFGDARAVLERLGPAVSPANWPRAALLYAQVLAEIGETALARQVFASIRPDTPIAVESDLAFGEFLMAAQTPTKPFDRVSTADALLGIDVFSRVLNRRPADARALIGRGRAFLALHRFDEARTDFARALALKPGWTRAELWLGVVASTRLRMPEARARLIAAAKNLADAVDAADALAAAGLLLSIDVQSGRDLRVAREWFSNLQARVPDPFDAALAKARAYLDARRFDDGRQWLDRAMQLIETDPLPIRDRARAFREIGDVQTALGRWAEAAESYTLALAVERFDRRSTRALYFLSRATARVPATEEKLQQYIKDDPASVEIAALLADLLSQSRSLDGRREWEKVQAIRPPVLTPSISAATAPPRADVVRLWMAVLDSEVPDRSRESVLTRAEALLANASPAAARQLIEVGPAATTNSSGRPAADERLLRHARRLLALSQIQLGQFAAAEAVLADSTTADDVALAALCALGRGATDDARLSIEKMAGMSEARAGVETLTMIAAKAEYSRATNQLDAAERLWERGAVTGAIPAGPSLMTGMTTRDAADWALMNQLQILVTADRAARAGEVLVRRRGEARPEAGRFQEMMLLGGLLDLSAGRSARDALVAVATWGDRRPGGSPDSRAARVAAGLLTAMGAEPIGPPMAVSPMARADVPPDLGLAERVVQEWMMGHRSRASERQFVAPDVREQWQKKHPRLQLIASLRDIATGNPLATARELAALAPQIASKTQSAGKLAPQTVVALARIVALARAGRFDDAREQLAAVVENNAAFASPRANPLPWLVTRYVAAQIAVYEGFVAKAVDILDECVREISTTDESLELARMIRVVRVARVMATWASGAGDTPAAAGDLASVLLGGRHPGRRVMASHVERLTMAALAHLRGDAMRARIEQLKAASSDAEWPAAHWLLVQALVELSAENPTAAREAVQHAQQIDPANPAAWRVATVVALASDSVEMIESVGIDGEWRDFVEGTEDVPLRALSHLLEAARWRRMEQPESALRSIYGVAGDMAAPMRVHFAAEAVRVTQTLDSGRAVLWLDRLIALWTASLPALATQPAIDILRRARIRHAAALGRPEQVLDDTQHLLRSESSLAVVAGPLGGGTATGLVPAMEARMRLLQWHHHARLTVALRSAPTYPPDMLAEQIFKALSPELAAVSEWHRGLPIFVAAARGLPIPTPTERPPMISMPASTVRRWAGAGAMSSGNLAMPASMWSADLLDAPLDDVTRPADAVNALDETATAAVVFARYATQLPTNSAEFEAVQKMARLAQKRVVAQLAQLDAIGAGPAEFARLDPLVWRIAMRDAAVEANGEQFVAWMQRGFARTNDPRILEAGLAIGGGLPDAVEAAETVMRTPPESVWRDGSAARIWTCIGIAHYRLGQFGSAANAFSRAAALMPPVPAIRDLATAFAAFEAQLAARPRRR